VALSRKVALTVDLEEWTVPQDFGGRQSRAVPENIRLEVARIGLRRLLNILNLEQVKTTFFVTTYFAQRNLPILRELLKAGHEIGNHGLDHGQRAGRRDGSLAKIRESTRVLEDLLGTKPCGYREQYFAVTRRMIGALVREDYTYDSSILGTWFPRRYRQWVATPPGPFVWNSTRERDAKLVELPVSVFSRLRIPVGWWWFRKNCGILIPQIAGKHFLRSDQPFILEMHSWELAEFPEDYSTPFHVRHNCGKTSADQIFHLIRGLKQSGGEFVLMKTLAALKSLDA
jgi:hypothetical protein